MRAIPMGLKVSSFLRTCSKSKVSKASGLIIAIFFFKCTFTGNSAKYSIWFFMSSFYDAMIQPNLLENLLFILSYVLG